MPNLALKKIEKFYLDNNDKVTWDFPLMRHLVDKIYVSCVFDWNKKFCREWEGIAEIGGSGYDLRKKLPPEIEKVKPKINIGFTTRGCIRNCYFCIVSAKEGKIRVEGDIYDIWDSKSKQITLLDNNILALPKHFELVCSQIRKENLIVDFNQGLDHRLLTKSLCKTLLSIKNKELRFAFDDIRYKPTVLRAISILKDCGVSNWATRWYLYVGEKDTFETVYERMKILQENKQGVYVMRDRKVYNKPEYIALASWGNTMGAFKMASLEEVLKESKRMKPYAKYFQLKGGKVK